MILIALGANLDSAAGSPVQTLDAALAAIEKDGVGIVRVSPYYITPAWPDPSDPSFVNAVACVGTTKTPQQLMALLHAVETAFGRVRAARNAPRTLDLDLVDYDGRVEEGPPVLPHPRMAERAFVLVPLADVAPGWTHPRTGQTVAALLGALPPEARAIERLASHRGN